LVWCPWNCTHYLYAVAKLAKSVEAISLGKRAAPFLRLPAQEGIGLFVNDIPGVGGVGLAKIDRAYVPRCT